MDDLKNKYEIRYLEGKIRNKKIFILEDLLQYEMEQTNVLIGELGIKDSGNVTDNIMNLNIVVNKKQLYPKLLSIILQDQEGEKYPEEFFSKCIAKDLEKPAQDFFDGEGSSMISGLTGIVLSPLLKLMQQNS